MKNKIIALYAISIIVIIYGTIFFRGSITISAQDNNQIMILAPKLYALIGQELNIYFDNIVNGKDTDYDFDVSCSIGSQLDYCYRVIPDKTGTYPITIKAYKNGKEVASVSSKIIVTNSQVGKGINKDILIIGDSTTASGICTQKLLDDFGPNDPMDITLLGSKGVLPNLNEGISGWKINDYFNSPGRDNKINAFWNNESKEFDFSYYMSSQGYKNVDYVILNLGINDTLSITDDVTLKKKTDEMLLEYSGMISSIHYYNPNIIIGIAITIPPAYDQNSFGKIYGCNQTRLRYKRNNYLWTKALIQKFCRKENDKVYLVPINTNLDTRYNMGLEYTQVNARNNSRIPTIIGSGSVHPAESGYWQIADIYWYWIKSFEN